jgi:hypothetical protein
MDLNFKRERWKELVHVHTKGCAVVLGALHLALCGLLANVYMCLLL